MTAFTRGQIVQVRSKATKREWVHAEVQLASPNSRSIAVELTNPVFIKDYTGGLAFTGVVPLTQSDHGDFTDMWGGNDWEVEVKP